MSRLTFDFITDEEFRSALASDYREMETCVEHGAWKAVHVLAGSMIEAVLVDYLMGAEQQTPDPLKMGLSDLIAACRKAGVLSQRTADLSGALKEYRNLIHPGRTKRLNERVDAEGAIVARSLVSIIVREVADKQQQAYGLTAEQIVNKFESDSSAIGISQHLLKDARDNEIERVLLKVLPERYFGELEGFDPSDAILEGHTKLFRAAFDLASEKTKKKVMERYVTVLREEPGPRVQVYEEDFFRASDLEFVAKAARPLVKAHLFERLRAEPSPKLFRAAEGVGEWLEPSDAQGFVDALMRTAVSQSAPLARRARKLLEDESVNTPVSVDKRIIKRLQSWENAYDARGSTEQADVARDLRRAYEVYQDIPPS